MSEEEKAPVEFGCFDREADLDISCRNLPHWFQVGAAMFITFRTADSMPQEVVLRWKNELEMWLAERNLPTLLAQSVVGTTLPEHDAWLNQLTAQERAQFKQLSDRAFHRSLDECHGACLLKRPDLAKIVGDAIWFYDDDKYDLDRFIVMPNHVHAIVQFRAGFSLKTVSQSWMRYTARKINLAVDREGVFWQPEPFDHIIRSADQFTYLQNYIEENPIKANLAKGESLFGNH